MKNKEFNWLSTIAPNLFCLRLVGVWPEKNKLYDFDAYTFYSAFNAVFIIAAHNLSQIINIFFVYNDLEALTATIFVLTTNILATIKMYLCARNLRVIKRLFMTLNTEPFLPKSEEQIKLIQPTLNQWRIGYFALCGLAGCNVFLWNISPMLNAGQKLPFLAWYPFDSSSGINYAVVYLYQVVCIWYITIGNANMDCLIYALLMYISCQCSILCDNLNNNEGDFGKNLVASIKHHKKILRFTEESNNFFNIVILGQFATSTVVLALTMFQLSLVSPVSNEAFTHVNYILGISTQLFFYCWFGNEVELKSGEIPFAAYKSQWLDQPNSVKKNMLILNLRTGKPIRITAINLFALSLQTFITILRSAWSYFAVLYKVNNP